MLKASKFDYPILPKVGAEDVSNDADKRCGDNPKVLGHCQVVEGSKHHHHDPKTEETVLDLLKHFIELFLIHNIEIFIMI